MGANFIRGTPFPALPAFVGDSGSGGKVGQVPAPPAATANVAFLKADGTWAVPLEPAAVDLERRFRLLLADYIQKFGPVPSLGAENDQALGQG